MDLSLILLAVGGKLSHIELGGVFDSPFYLVYLYTINYGKILVLVQIENCCFLSAKTEVR